MAQYKDGDTKTIGGVAYTRQNGQWLPANAGGPNVVIPAAPKPKDLRPVPGHPNLLYDPESGSVVTIPGVEAPPPPKQPEPTFVPGKPGVVVTGPPDSPRAVPIAGLPQPGPDMTAQRSAALQQFNYAQQLQGTIDELTKLYNAGPGATKGVGGLKDYLPFTANEAFDTKANAARGIVGQALGFTGGQLNTEKEAAKAIGPYLPQASDRDAVIVQKLNTLQTLADNARQNAIQTLGGVPDANGNIAPAPPSAAPASSGGLNGEDVSLAKGQTRTVVDPVLKATGQRLGAMVSSGASKEAIYKFLQDNKINPANTNIDEVLQQRDSPEGKRLLRANPGKAWTIGPEFYTKEVPMSGARAMGNMAAQSAPGAFLAAAANGITGGYLDNMTDNPEMARTGMQLLRSEHPVASLAGDISGYATDEALLGRIPGMRGFMATKFGRRAADAGYGAFSGSGENDDDRLAGAAIGAPLNTLGGMFGRGLQKGVGATLTGIRNPGLQLLHKENVPLTIGQIGRGAGDFTPDNPATVGDIAGREARGFEDRLAGLPGLDAVIGTARQRGDQGFNAASFRAIAPGVTGTGAEGLASAKAAETAAYSKLNPVRISIDPEFDGSLSSASEAAKGLAHHAGDVNSVIADIRQQIADGGMTGKGYQTALQTIRKTRATLNDDVGGKAAALLTDLESSMAGLGARQGGTVAQDLADANAIHGRREIVKKALKGAGAQSNEEMFSPKDLNRAAVSNTERFGGLDRALSSDRPFYDLTTAGMKAMPNLTPDSGTAGRLALYPLIASTGGAGIGAAVGGDDRAGSAQAGGEMGAGLGLLALGLGAGPYSKGGQRLLQNMLLSERPEAINVLGEALKRHPKLAGMFGAGAARDYFMQPELPQGY